MNYTVYIDADKRNARVEVSIPGVTYPKRFLTKCGVKGIRLYGEKYTREIEISHSALYRFIAVVNPWFDIHLRITERVELVCTHECLAAQAEDTLCECRCRGAFHGQGAAPPGVRVVNADEPSDAPVWVTFSGVIHRGKVSSAKDAALGVREELFKAAVAKTEERSAV